MFVRICSLKYVTQNMLAKNAGSCSKQVGVSDATHLCLTVSIWDSPAPNPDRSAGSFEGLKLEERSGAHRVRTAGSGRREQAFFNSVQAFPGSLSECRIGSDDVADHLPGGEVERALRCGARRQ